jgi:hypothetical protein
MFNTGTGREKPDFLATVDVDPNSPTYSEFMQLLFYLHCCKSLNSYFLRFTMIDIIATKKLSQMSVIFDSKIKISLSQIYYIISNQAAFM